MEMGHWQLYRVSPVSKEDSFCHEEALTHPLLFLSRLDVCFHESCFIRPGATGGTQTIKDLVVKVAAEHRITQPFPSPSSFLFTELGQRVSHKLRELPLMTACSGKG